MFAFRIASEHCYSHSRVDFRVDRTTLSEKVPRKSPNLSSNFALIRGYGLGGEGEEGGVETHEIIQSQDRAKEMPDARSAGRGRSFSMLVNRHAHFACHFSLCVCDSTVNAILASFSHPSTYYR